MEYKRREIEHHWYCLDGIPIPRRDPDMTEEDVEVLRVTLDALMSRYDEMPLPEAMLPDEKPFQYIHWLIAQRYMTVNVTFECDHFEV